MRENKDYYKLLELTDEDKKLSFNEFKKKLKQNYKKLALLYHPDRQQGKSEDEKKIAEEKFKNIGEAYEVLSDEEKKKQYDNPIGGGFNFNSSNFGSSPFGSVFGDDIEEFMSNFGFGNMGKRNHVAKGQSIRIVIPLTIQEIYNGITKQFKYNRNVICDDCKGSGMTTNSKKEMCEHCGGTGKLFKQNGKWQTIETCHYCGGKGFTIKNPCTKCSGSGLITKNEIVDITIPKGIYNGSQLVINGKGNSIPNGDDGDLLVVIKEREDSKFIRQDNDIYFELEIPIIDAMLGCDRIVETIDGKKLTTRIQNGISSGSKIRFSKKGMPIYGRDGEFGDMYGIVKLIIPNKLSDDEIKTLKTLQGKGNFK